MPTHTASAKKVSKSTLSMFLRTHCDKELFLSLHDKSAIGASGLPAPVKRPGIGILSTEGKDFELDRNDQLLRLFGGIVRHSRGSGKFNDIDLEHTLTTVTVQPAILLQSKFSIGSIKDQTLINIGLSPTDTAVVPDIADFIPDVLVVRSARDADLEIRPNGSRATVDPLLETRFAIDILDIKHTSEANPSYCAEIAMYALMLANWLDSKPALRTRFFVTASAYLWTRFKQGDSELGKLEARGGATADQLLKALVADSEDANLRFYLAAVRRFFEDVVRVIRIGDASHGAWANLEWHVSGSCGNCDWLGDKRHLSSAYHPVVDANPLHYCMPAASLTGHLSLVPGITRGAKKTLQLNAVPDASTLAGASGHPALQQHTMLKREARNLPTRTNAILSQVLSSDPTAAIASLAGFPNLHLFASVNFDSSSGLLTGLALSGFATTYTSGQSPTRFSDVPYVVDQKSLQAEWVAVEAFLSHIADCISRTERLVSNPTGQIHFWEERQFKELCNAIGRHLPRVLALTTRKAAALAWVFPPEEFIARPESLEASTVVIIEDIIRRMVFTPTPHVITLFDTAESYPAGPVQTVRDPYYREYLSNGIPRERIYEIWSNTSQVKRGKSLLPRNTVISEYSEALKKQSRALESICERLRRDYRNHIKAKATRIPSSVPLGARGVAFDSKLWIWWDSLNFNASQLEAHIRLAMDGERLEASYEAVLLSRGRLLPSGRYEFDVAITSTEAKFKEDSMLTLGKLGRPGFPLEHATALLSSSAPIFSGNQNLLRFPLWSVLKATIVAFDRAHRRIQIALVCEQEPLFVPYLLSNSNVDLLNDVFLLETKKPAGFDWSRTSSQILQEIGDPPIATPDQNAAKAMGITPKTRRSGRGTAIKTSAPVAQVLWDAPSLEQLAHIPAADAVAIADYVRDRHSLNTSQVDAIQHAAERALTIMWGPPGTGKTKTLAALLHGLTHQAAVQHQPLKVLVTGPTYKAVEEIMDRTARCIASDSTTPCTMFMGYSRQRALGNLSFQSPPHLQYTPFALDNNEPDCQQCLQMLSPANPGVIIVGAQVRQARRFSQWLHGTFVQPVFDIVIIDESSQVPVSQSLSALCGLKCDARLVIAGDHLQMPPIATMEPPVDAAYLVGSIQTYLRERSFNQAVERSILERNYRSGEDIVAFARTIGYPATLQAEHPNTRLHLLTSLPTQAEYPGHLPWCTAFNDLLSPNNCVVTLLHEDEISSQGNLFEAQTVAGIVWMLRQTVSRELDGRESATPLHIAPTTAKEFWDRCIGIVTPHRAQRALIIRELEKLFPGENNFIDEAVDTVERFQGGERHSIIVSFGVADTEIIAGEEAFLMQLERTNVAVSRAMAKCIMVMPKTLAAHIPEDKKALSTAFAVKDYVEEFCNIRVDTMLIEPTQSRRAQVRYHR